ncbi:hypothetical protein KKI24_28595 [bacterium]|nr:hypothetical protein [bacterium]
MKISEKDALGLLSGFLPLEMQAEESASIDGRSYAITMAIDNADGLLLFKAGPSEQIDRFCGDEPVDGCFMTRLDPLVAFRRYHAMAAAKGMAVPAAALRQVTGLIHQLVRFFSEQDCLILKLDPITINSTGEVAWSGCQLEVDDDALFRQPGLSGKGIGTEHPLERRGQSQGITYVDLGGKIAILSAGAGSTMAVVDLVHHFGGEPANFVDAMGGAGLETIRNLVDLVLTRAETDPAIKVILLVMHLSATPMKPIVETFCQVIQARRTGHPLVGYLHAGGSALLNYSLGEAQELFRSCGFQIFADLSDAIREAVRLSS